MVTNSEQGKIMARTLAVIILGSIVHTAPLLASVQSLEQVADVIVVGRTSTVAWAWPDTNFDLTIERSLKGTLGSGRIVQVKANYPYSRDVGVKQVSQAHRGIWFLKLQSGGWYRCLPANPGVNVPLSAAYLHLPSVSPNALELVPTPNDSLPDTIIRLSAGSLEERGGNAEEFLTAAFGTDSPVVRAILHYFARSNDPIKRMAGFAGLIERGDKQALLDFLKDMRAFSTIQVDRVSARIRSFRTTDANVVIAMGSVMVDPSYPRSLRDAIAKSLRAVHTKETLPYFAALLNDLDLDRQIDAVFGMSGFANGFGTVLTENMASMQWLTNRRDTPFTSEQTKQYMLLTANSSTALREQTLTFWRNWWQDHRADLTRR